MLQSHLMVKGIVISMLREQEKLSNSYQKKSHLNPMWNPRWHKMLMKCVGGGNFVLATTKSIKTHRF